MTWNFGTRSVLENATLPRVPILTGTSRADAPRCTTSLLHEKMEHRPTSTLHFDVPSACEPPEQVTSAYRSASQQKQEPPSRNMDNNAIPTVFISCHLLPNHSYQMRAHSCTYTTKTCLRSRSNAGPRALRSLSTTNWGFLDRSLSRLC